VFAVSFINCFKILYVTGILLNVVVAKPFVQPLNHTVVFLKETEIVFTSDTWRIALNFDLSTYHEIISTIRTDLLSVEQRKKEYTPIVELKQIEIFFNILESKLYDFYQVLPRLELRRALVNFGGKILKTLFGTATTSDIHLLHDVLHELQFQNSDISHSLSNLFTYVKKLNTDVKIDTEAVANLSNIIKDNMIQPHEKFQVARDKLWLNITLFGQSELHTVIRQLEFTLFQLVQQIDDLFDIIQCAMHGRLSIKLVNPTVLQNILRNVTLRLSEGYELIAGTNIENIRLCYDMTAVSIVANTHCINLLLHIPLKSANRHFTLFKVITLPTRIF